MNANELANLLEVDSWYKLVTREEIATMLRQQQAEIKALKEALSMKVILNEHAQQSMKEIKELLK
jgi:guanylate kinase